MAGAAVTAFVSCLALALAGFVTVLCGSALTLGHVHLPYRLGTFNAAFLTLNPSAVSQQPHFLSCSVMSLPVRSPGLAPLGMGLLLLLLVKGLEGAFAPIPLGASMQRPATTPPEQ